MTIAELFAKLKIQPDSKSFDAADKMIGGLKMALGALAAAAGFRFFAGMITDTVKLGGELNDTAVATATNVEELQALGFAAQQNGSSLESMADGLGKLSRNAYEAANGNKAMAESFAKAGIKVKDANGQLRPAADLLGDVSDHLASIPEEERVGVAMDLMGKSAKGLIPTLAGGRAELERLKQEAIDLGAVMSEDTVAALDDFGDEQDKVSAAMSGLRNTVVAELLPTMKVMVKDLLEWVKANRVIIAQKLKMVLEGIIWAMKGFARVVSVAVDVVSWLGKNMGVLAAGIGAVSAAMIVFKYESIAAALASAGAWIMAALPIVIVAAGLFAIILILQDLYSWFNGGDSVLKDFFGMFKEFIGEKLTALWDSTIGYLIDKFQSFITWVVEKIEWVWSKIKAVGSAIDRAVFGTKEGAINMLANFGITPEQAASMPASDPNAGWLANMMPSVQAAATGTTVGDVTIQVTPPPGSNSKEIAEQTKNAFDEHMKTILRTAKAGIGGK